MNAASHSQKDTKSFIKGIHAAIRKDRYVLVDACVTFALVEGIALCLFSQFSHLI